MKTKMTQMFLEELGGQLVPQEVDIPKPYSGQVTLKINVATVCTLTDLNIIEGTHAPHDWAVEGMLPHDLRVHLGQENDPFIQFYPKRIHPRKPFPTPMGHEASGTIVEIGNEANLSKNLVLPEQKLAVGDRVTTFKIPGAYSEYSCLDSSNVAKITDDISDEEGALIEPLIINYNCIKKCYQVGVGDTVVILGQGCQGLLATQVAKILGAKKIIVSEPLSHRRKLALEFGADIALNPNETNIVHAIEELTGGKGVDLVLECAGISETIQTMPYIVRRGGIIGQIGAIGVPVMFDYGYVHFKHYTTIPADYVTNLKMISQQLKEILEFIRSGKIILKPLISHKFSLEDINDAFDMLRSNKNEVIKVAILP